MRPILLAHLLLAALACCSDSKEPPVEGPVSTPRGTIAALSRTLREGDFEAFASLHTEECFAEAAEAWRKAREEMLGDPGGLRREAERLGMTEAQVMDMTWRDAVAVMFRSAVAQDPGWTAHLLDLTVIEERTEGDSSRITVRYGEPKADEIHDLDLVRRDGRWLVREWNSGPTRSRVVGASGGESPPPRTPTAAAADEAASCAIPGTAQNL